MSTLLLEASGKKSMFPWFILASLIALLASGGSGMYFGYEIANGRFAQERLELEQTYSAALLEKEKRRLEAETRSQLVEGTFLTALNNMRVVNTTNYQEVQTETQKIIYTDCKLPDSGVDLLNKQVDGVNMRLLSKEKP